MVEPILSLTAHFVEGFICEMTVTDGNGVLKILLFPIYYSNAFMSVSDET